MREIKFRGKRVDNGEWAYGFYFLDAGTEEVFILENFLYDLDSPRLNIQYICHAHEVDPATVGQYTELKDKNGVEIFEGDIVDSTSELFTDWGKVPTGKFVTSLYEILWHEDGWATKEIHNDRWTKTWNNYGFITQNTALLCEKYFVVIGNIHDNPELLKP